MLARAHTFAVDGLHAHHVTVELDVRRGLPAFTIVGLAGAAVREARERVRASILNCGYEFPARRIVANLAPGDLPKAGAGFDLALACAVLAASGQLSGDRLGDHALFGELSLDGTVRASPGTLAVTQAAKTAGLRAICLAPASAPEAMLAEGIELSVVGDLGGAARVLEGGRGDPLPRRGHPSGVHAEGAPPGPDLADVHGQHHAIEALVVAAAGGHNLLLSGPPGTGKTMLAQRMASILPPLTADEALELTRIHSAASGPVCRLISRRPFRAPHHSITAAGLVGGAQRGWMGEIVLAHNGVLFLDELSEFSRATLEALRQPLEDGRIAVVRARHSAVYPARFMLLAATNPCPCGHAGEDTCCRCTPADHARHRRRLSGPLLDRIDLLVHTHRDTGADCAKPPVITSSAARERVLEARARQAARQGDGERNVNARVQPHILAGRALVEPEAEQLIRRALRAGLLSARGRQRVLRVARTIADLDASEGVRARHVAQALGYRADTTQAGERAA